MQIISRLLEWNFVYNRDSLEILFEMQGQVNKIFVN